MKRLFGIMNLILCLELIIGPHFPGTRIFSMEVARAETCPAGLVMDSTLNRCITSDQQAAVMNATFSCNGDKECYKRLAEEELKKGEEEGKIEEQLKDKGGLINKGLKVAAIAAPLMIAAQSLMKAKCMAPSTMAMVASGAALFIGDMMANKKHKSCLKKIRDDWEKNKAATTEKTASGITKVSMAQDQSEAFEMLAKAEDCMQSSAKMKAGFYMAGSLGFAAAAVLAYMEEVKLKGLLATNPPAGAAYAKLVMCSKAPTGTSTGSSPDKYLKSILPIATDLPSLITLMQSQEENFWEKRSSPSIDHYEFNKKLFGSESPQEKSNFKMISTALVSTFSNLNPIPTAEANVVPPAANPVGGAMLRPIGRAIISGVLAVWGFMMMQHAKKQAKVAGNRAEFLRNMKKEFDDATGAISCTAEERDISANANCYCYTEGGQRNQGRANSQVCQQLWTGQTLAKAGEYNSLDFSNQRVCISASGAPDENCACKASKNCLNAIPSMGNLVLGAISVASNGMKPLNDLANGQVGAGSINSAAAGSLAAKLLDEKNKLQNKAKLDPNKQKSLSKQIEGSLIAAGAGQPSPIQIQSSLPMNMSGGDAARALEKELGDGRSFEQIGGSPALAQPGNATPGDAEGFSLGTPDAAAISENQLAEAMAQDLNYGQNDITKSDSNIFDIVTNRYQRSGMRRLFDDDAKAEPEKANKNDISQ